VSLGASLFRTETVTAEEVEKLKAGDELAMLIDGFSGAVPGVKTALIDERDQYMSAKILAGPGRCVVAVVGAGHVPGIKRLFGSAIALDELEKVPPPKRALKVIGWGVPALLLVLVASGFFIAGRETGQQMIVAWSLANGISASIGTALALAHPLTIIAAFVAAPITSLNPTIAAGWVCGLVEAYLRKPRVVDLENVADDLGSIRGIWGNRVIKVLLVVVLANLGSSLGTLLGISWIISLLGG
jgi:pheromone shutdown-related protein TraB